MSQPHDPGRPGAGQPGPTPSGHQSPYGSSYPQQPPIPGGGYESSGGFGQPGPYGGYPPPPPPRKDRAGMRRWGKILTLVGVVILVLSVAVGVILAVAGIGNVVDQADKAFQVDPTAEQYYDAGDEFQLFSTSASNGVPACEITGPAALAPGTNTTTEFTFDGSGVESFDSFQVVESGTYSFRCDSPAVVASLDASGIFSGVGGVLLAVFGGGLGGLLALVGIVLWIVAGRKPATA
ncbi:hypothetical protein M1C59_07035 [Gordonia terrae]|uniref:hypothetical protein n=1 Tax=Gordonia terrae TaxID=2055 RepID=UPI00200B35E6|nr:hypothetical protein [Gordonia terrae]UPW10580.1 hypothetical protein M1C59_07035 [Gordonia terrae]